MSPGKRLLFGLTLVVGLVSASLGMWQLRRLFARRAVNERALSQRDLAVVDLTQGSLVGQVSFRRVTLAGTFDFEREIVLRGRLLRGAPGIQVVTPLRIEGRDTAIFVNRGFVPTPDAGSIRDAGRYREPEQASLAGIAVSTPDDHDGMPLATRLGETWRRLDLTALRARLPYPIAPYYVIAAAADTGGHSLRGHTLPLRVEPPPLDDGPHLSYAIQWFLIGGAALGFGVFFIWRGGGPRV